MKPTDEQVIEAAKNNLTMTLAAAAIGLKFSTFKRRAQELGVYEPNQGAKGTSKPNTFSKIDLQEILSGLHPQYQTYKLKHRLFAEGLKQNKCECCGIDSWMNHPIECELDHIDGDRTNHRLENLRILCPNCHAQTDTYCGKNKGKMLH